jgi:hypothetical protein
VNLFFDNMLAPALTRAICEFLPCARPNVVERVVHIRGMFHHSTEDQKWLSELKDDHWVILTADLRIQKSSAARSAWMDNRHVVFFLGKGWTNLRPFEQLERMAHVLPRILELASEAERPSGFKVPASSRKIEQLNVHSER